jgi:hypothetical protein
MPVNKVLWKKSPINTGGFLSKMGRGLSLSILGRIIAKFADLGRVKSWCNLNFQQAMGSHI